MRHLVLLSAALLVGLAHAQDGGMPPKYPIVMGSLDKEVIRKGIHANRAQMRKCYESAIKRKPGIAGKEVVKFTISREGPVSAAEITEDTVGDPEMHDCIIAAVKTWNFPAPVGGGIVIVTYPFTFAAK